MSDRYYRVSGIAIYRWQCNCPDCDKMHDSEVTIRELVPPAYIDNAIARQPLWKSAPRESVAAHIALEWHRRVPRQEVPDDIYELTWREPPKVKEFELKEITE